MPAISLLILLLIIIVLMIYIRRRQNSNQQQSLQQYIDRSSGELFNQFESYHYIRDRLNLKQGLPYTRDWSASPDFLKRIAEHCLQYKPETIVECSSGLSSLVLARCCQINKKGKVFSLENGEEFARASRGHINRYQLDEYAQIIHAPLINHSINGRDFQWYDISQLPDASINMLVIDGPPGFIQTHSRYPALPLLQQKMANDCVIFMDDAARDDEKEIVDKWLAEYPGWRHEYVSLLRGCSVLRKLTS